MAQYQYAAKNMEGRVLRGRMEAVSENALQQQLKEQGLYLIKVKNVSEVKEQHMLSSKQIAEFCREMSALLTSGVSIVRGLEILVDEEGVPESVRFIYREMLAELKRGTSLSEAMEMRRCFPELMLGMIRSGEGSGNIDEVMDRLALHYERDNRLKQQVQSAMTYPMVLVVMSVAVVILIVTFILPQFDSRSANVSGFAGGSRNLDRAAYPVENSCDPQGARLCQSAFSGCRETEQSHLYGAVCQDAQQPVFQRYADRGSIADGRGYHWKYLCGGAVCTGGIPGAQRCPAFPGIKGGGRASKEAVQHYPGGGGKRAAGYRAGFDRPDHGGGSRGGDEEAGDHAGTDHDLYTGRDGRIYHYCGHAADL